MTTPRPTERDQEIIARAARRALPEFIEWLDGGPRGEIFEHLKETLAGFHSDGYARAAEWQRLWYYTPDAQLVDLLHNLDARRELREATKQWVIDNNLEPPFPAGTKVIVPYGRKEVEGEMQQGNDYHNEQAESVVFCESLGHVKDGLGTYGLVIKWEHIKRAEVAA